MVLNEVVNNTTYNSGHNSKVEKKAAPNKGMKTAEPARSVRQALNIWFDNHPDDAVAITDKLIQGAKAGDWKAVELVIKLKDGFDVERLDVTSGGNRLTNVRVEFSNGE